jgi:hypothetical protein
LVLCVQRSRLWKELLLELDFTCGPEVEDCVLI